MKEIIHSVFAYDEAQSCIYPLTCRGVPLYFPQSRAQEISISCNLFERKYKIHRQKAKQMQLLTQSKTFNALMNAFMNLPTLEVSHKL